MANPKDGVDDEFFGALGDVDDYHVSNPNSAAMDDRNPIDDMTDYESRATGEKFRNMGFLETFEHAKEIQLQQGFEAGYRRTFDVSMRIGEILGRASASKFQASANDESSTELQEISSEILSRLKDIEAMDLDHSKIADAADSLRQLETALKKKTSKNMSSPVITSEYNF
jgi:hypothetical protein